MVRLAWCHSLVKTLISINSAVNDKNNNFYLANSDNICGGVIDTGSTNGMFCCSRSKLYISYYIHVSDITQSYIKRMCECELSFFDCHLRFWRETGSRLRKASCRSPKRRKNVSSFNYQLIAFQGSLLTLSKTGKSFWQRIAGSINNERSWRVNDLTSSLICLPDLIASDRSL